MNNTFYLHNLSGQSRSNYDKLDRTRLDLHACKKTLTFGREGNLVCEDHFTSRVHAEIQFKNGAIFVRDLGSKNGTFVDGKKIPVGKKIRVPPHSKIRFGYRTWVLSRQPWLKKKVIHCFSWQSGALIQKFDYEKTRARFSHVPPCIAPELVRLPDFALLSLLNFFSSYCVFKINFE